MATHIPWKGLVTGMKEHGDFDRMYKYRKKTRINRTAGSDTHHVDPKDKE